MTAGSPEEKMIVDKAVLKRLSAALAVAYKRGFTTFILLAIDDEVRVAKPSSYNPERFVLPLERGEDAETVAKKVKEGALIFVHGEEETKVDELPQELKEFAETAVKLGVAKDNIHAARWLLEASRVQLSASARSSHYILIDFRPCKQEKNIWLTVYLAFVRHPSQRAIFAAKTSGLPYARIWRPISRRRGYEELALVLLRADEQAAQLAEWLGLRLVWPASKLQEGESISLEEALEGWDFALPSELAEELERDQLPKQVVEEELRRAEKETREVEVKGEGEAGKLGLMKIRLICFDLTSEYKGAPVRRSTNDDGTIEERRRLRKEAPKIARLRSRFYSILHRFAFKTVAGWVVYNEDKFKEYLPELNEVFSEYEKILGRKPRIYIIEVYAPKFFIRDELSAYIEERRAILRNIKERIEKEARRQVAARLRYELRKLEEELAELERVWKEIAP